MNRRQSIAVPSASNKENTGKAAKIRRAQSIGGSNSSRKSIIGADGLSPKRRKRLSMMPRKSILKSRNDDGEQTMDMTTVVGGIASDITMGRKSMLDRRVSFAQMAQVRLFDERTSNSNATGSSPQASSSPAAKTPTPEPRKNPAPMHRADSEEIGEGSMEIDDESAEPDNSLGLVGEPFDAGEDGGGEDSMDLTETYQHDTPSRPRLSGPIAPLPPLDRSMQSDKDSGEFLVKVGKSIVPKRHSELWAELKRIANGEPDLDEDHTGSTTESDSGVVPIQRATSTQHSGQNSQDTYASRGTFSSQESRTAGDMALDDALARLRRASRPSIGGRTADMSIDEDADDSLSTSSGDRDGGWDDEKTMDLTTLTGGLRYHIDEDDEEPTVAGIDNPGPPAHQTPAPFFEFRAEPETHTATVSTSVDSVSRLATVTTSSLADILVPTPTVATVPPPFVFALAPSPKTTNIARPNTAAVEPTDLKSLTPPGAGSSPYARSPVVRPPVTFEVSQSPIRAPPVFSSPRNSPAPFQFVLPETETPRRESRGHTDRTPVRAVTPVPQGTPKVVDAPPRALSAPPTPKRMRDEDKHTEESEGPARKKVALGEPESTQQLNLGAEKGPTKPPRRRSYAPRPSIMRIAQQPVLPTILASSPVREPERLMSPMAGVPDSPAQDRVALPRPSTPPSGTGREHELRRQAPTSPFLSRESPHPTTSLLDDIRASSPLRARAGDIGQRISFGAGVKSPAQWRNGVQNEADFDEIPSISATEFLKMTRMSFMDGLTAKRPSTIGLGVLGREEQMPTGIGEYVTAMTVGVPQLETYNYAAKELKEYISNGKKAIRILEEDLDANNPYLFKEYLTSGEEDRRAIEETLGGHKEAMRMRSKMSWYKWRLGFVQEMQVAADQETGILRQDLESMRAASNQLADPIPSLQEQHAKLKAQLAAERAAVEAVKTCDPEVMEELKAGIAEQNTQIESYKADVQSSTVKLEKLKAKLEEVEGEKRALLEQMRVHQEQLDALHPTVEILNLRDEFEKLQRLHLWGCVKLEEKHIELVYDERYRVQLDCVAYRPIPSKCRIQALPPRGQQKDQFPVLTELVLDLAQAMLRQTASLSLKKVVRMLGRLWASISHLRCNLRLLAMKYPVTITRTNSGFGFNATTRMRFPRSNGLAKITFTAGEQHIRDWGKQLHTMGAEVDVVYGNLDREVILDVVKDRISEAAIEESYGLMLDACADAVASAEQ